MGDEQSFLSSYKKDLERAKQLGMAFVITLVCLVIAYPIMAYAFVTHLFQADYVPLAYSALFTFDAVLIYYIRNKNLRQVANPSRLEVIVSRVSSGDWSSEAGEAAMSLRRKYDEKWTKATDAENEMLAKLSEAVRSARMKSR